MINLIITIFGGLLVIAGFYAMSFGFATPPNSLFFFLGLCAAVMGVIVVVFFAGRVDLSRKESTTPSKAVPTTPTMKARPKPVKVEKAVSKDERKKETLDSIEKTIKPKPRIKKPKKVERKEITPQISQDKIGAKSESSKKIGMTEIQPPKDETSKSLTLPPELKAKEPQKIEPVKASPSTASEEPVKTSEPSDKEKSPIPKRPDMSKYRSIQPKKEDEFVKKRLDRLKESYIQNAKDIESIIDERLDSFKGTLGKLKSESKEPGIIWSFDHGDVQEAMIDIISKANNRILMMYPWIRNIDVGILKKFMETESCMIVQEASLDDDASVELLKLLMEKNVKIRTMPHVHTIAIVSDDTNGLIISTDPIYESYEVGVVYKDLKSIEEIESLFKDAWSISQDIDLEIKS